MGEQKAQRQRYYVGVHCCRQTKDAWVMTKENECRLTRERNYEHN